MPTSYHLAFALLNAALTSAISDPLITAAPPTPFRDKLNRRAIDTCGYINGDIKLPKTCNPPYTCTYPNLLDQPFMDCCNEVECAPGEAARTCIGHDSGDCQGEIYSPACESAYTSVMFCTDLAAPACVTYYKTPTDMYALSSTTVSFGCGASSAEIPILPTPTRRGAKQELTSTSANGFSNSIDSSTDFNSILGITPTTSGSGNEPSSSTSTKAKPSNAPLLSTTAIIAIVVGLILVAAVALLTWCCLRGRAWRRRQKPHIPFDQQSISGQTGFATSESGVTVMQWLDSQGRVRHN